MAKFNPMSAQNPFLKEDKEALSTQGSTLLNMAGSLGANYRTDSAENPGVFFAMQLAHIKAKAYDKIYPELTGLSLFPMTSDADDGAEYIEYFSYEKTGIANIISNYANDLARVDVKGAPHRAKIVSLGDSYGYNVQEMRAARRNAILQMGKPLDAGRAEAARYAYDVSTNHLIWNGDAETGVVGIFSSGNNIPVITLSNGASGKADWDNKTADEIAADFTLILNTVSKTTRGVEHPDSVVMAEDRFNTLTSRRITGTDATLMEYLQKAFGRQIKNWEVANELSASNTDYNSTGKNRCLFYTKDAEKLSRETPMPFRQYPVQPRNLEMVVNCEGREAGVMIYYPMSAAIVNGI